MREPHLIRQLLELSPFSNGLVDRQIELLAEMTTQQTHSAGAILFTEGDSAKNLSIICDGAIALDMRVPLRGSIRILTLGPRDILGWSALVGDGIMSATATVLEDASILNISVDQLKDQCVIDHELGYSVMSQVARALAHRLRGTRLQLLDLFSETEPTLSQTTGRSGE